MRFTENMINKRVIDGTLFNKLNDQIVECYACAHRCKIREGKKGICRVRFNNNGILKVPSGYTAALHNDPIEKKPFYHAYPSTNALSIGMLGCNLKCAYCQNWQISQTLRDPEAGVSPRDISVESIINYAINVNSRSIISTYNEPLITSEWAYAIFKEAKKNNLATGYVSSGNATTEVLDYLKPVTDLYKIDLKSFNEKNYKKLGANLEDILHTIEEVYRRGFWMELVTLIIPDFNNSDAEIRQMAEYIHGISPNIPWHLSAYHQDYKMENDNTTMNDLVKAAEIGTDVGLNYIYAGNIYNGNNWRDTKCHQCKAVLVKRSGYQITKYHMNDNRCPKCDTVIPGLWEKVSERKKYFDLYS